MKTAKQIQTQIKGINARSATLRQSVQECLCNIAGHAKDHGDVRLYSDLLAATTGLSQARISSWIKEFGLAVVNKDGTVKLNAKARGEVDMTGEALVEDLLANARNWWEDKEPKASSKAYDIVKAMATIVSVVQKGEKEIDFTYNGVQEQFEQLMAALKRADENSAEHTQAVQLAAAYGVTAKAA